MCCYHAYLTENDCLSCFKDLQAPADSYSIDDLSIPPWLQPSARQQRPHVNTPQAATDGSSMVAAAVRQSTQAADNHSKRSSISLLDPQQLGISSPPINVPTTTAKLPMSSCNDASTGVGSGRSLPPLKMKSSKSLIAAATVATVTPKPKPSTKYCFDTGTAGQQGPQHEQPLMQQDKAAERCPTDARISMGDVTNCLHKHTPCSSHIGVTGTTCNVQKESRAEDMPYATVNPANRTSVPQAMQQQCHEHKLQGQQQQPAVPTKEDNQHGLDSGTGTGRPSAAGPPPAHIMDWDIPDSDDEDQVVDAGDIEDWGGGYNDDDDTYQDDDQPYDVGDDACVDDGHDDANAYDSAADGPDEEFYDQEDGHDQQPGQHEPDVDLEAVLGTCFPARQKQRPQQHTCHAASHHNSQLLGASRQPSDMHLHTSRNACPAKHTRLQLDQESDDIEEISDSMNDAIADDGDDVEVAATTHPHHQPMHVNNAHQAVNTAAAQQPARYLMHQHPATSRGMASAVSGGEPWWSILPDFVPVQAVAGGRDPR